MKLLAGVALYDLYKCVELRRWYGNSADWRIG